MRIFLAFLLSAFSLFCQGEIIVRDDTGQTLRLKKPARRIVSLAPHLTEMVYAAGAGQYLVAAVDFSDYPPAARHLPRIGSHDRIDLEALLAHHPDLVVAWQSSTPPVVVSRMRRLGLNLFVSKSSRIDDLGHDLERLAALAGTDEAGRAAAGKVRQKLAGLRKQYADKPGVRVFYQLWNRPLMTVGKPQVISEVIRLCGGRNVFASLDTMAPVVSIEAVLAARPEVIIAAGMGDARPEWLDDWKRWKDLPAVVHGNLFHIHPDLMHRHTPRLLDGAETLCRQLETARRPTSPER